MAEIPEILDSGIANGLSRFTFGPRILLTIMVMLLVALGLASYISYSVSPISGLIFFIVLLFVLIGLAVFSGDRLQRDVWIALGLAPLIRIMSLALPVISQLSQYIWYIAISIPILIAVISIIRLNKYSLEQVGLSLNEGWLQILVASGGVILGTAGFYFLKTSAWTPYFSLYGVLFPALVLVIFTGFIEELVFRGLMQRAMEGLGAHWWIYVAVIYAVLQIGHGSLSNCFFALVLSLYFGYMVKQTGSIVGASLGHGLVNAGLFLVLPYVLVF